MTFLARLKGALGLKAEKPVRIEPQFQKPKVRKPIGRKRKYTPVDERRHMDAVAQLPCVCCGSRPVELHHPICGRYSQRKAPNKHVIPLCHLHHLGAEGIHPRREWWVETYGPDTDYIAVVADQLAGEFNSPWGK